MLDRSNIAWRIRRWLMKNRPRNWLDIALAVIAGAILAGALLIVIGSCRADDAPPPHEGYSLDAPIDELLPDLKEEEGFRAHPYRDTRGNLTVGYGTNLSLGITEQQGEALSIVSLQQNWRELIGALPWVTQQPPRIQIALLDMVYQEGIGHLLGFKNMLAAMKRGDYKAAREEALDSDWARQTPNRAERVIARFPTGE